MTERRDRKFCRVYYDDLEQEFPEVYADPRLFWAWFQLLVRAERSWPSVPELPRAIRRAVIDRLVGLGLVVLVPPFGYRVRGLDAERKRRQVSAKLAADARWGRNAAGNADGDAGRIADALPVAMPRRDETSTRRESRVDSSLTSGSARPAAVHPVRDAG